ncbi:tetratricopeptide repeat protein [Streptomyces sp. NPDC059517]|uniref:tetratricopeptide repeat protein n=1 Tax=Streptomyces sp. NPDC059517 TaxID=3346855 RepID=UPI00368D5BEC
MHSQASTPGPSRPSRRLRSAVVTLALGAALFTTGAVVLTPDADTTTAAEVTGRPAPARGTLGALQYRVHHVPQDAGAWAALGMAYVQQARTTADPGTYNRAEKALRRSLAAQPDDNTNAQIGMGALAAARHDFRTALDWARQATASNPYNPVAYGVLADAYTQLGQYPAAYRAVQRMNDLRPDAPALARASYTFELRGDTGQAVTLMRRSLNAASTTGERSFAHAVLSTLALQSGDARQARREAQAGLRQAPGDSALLEARARAQAALGNTRQALADYRAAIAIVPLPHYLLGLGELQQSLGHPQEAEAQYAVLRGQETIRRSGPTPADTDAILFEADHGHPSRAVTIAQKSLRTRPFIAVHDALAWALHRDGRNREALGQADQALALGTRSALFLYHRAVIHHSLGDDAAARSDLQAALRTEPHFHPLHAATARALLQRIDTTP